MLSCAAAGKMNSASKPNSPTSFFIYGILLRNECGKRLCLEAS